jgi:hypothetical protein
MDIESLRLGYKGRRCFSGKELFMSRYHDRNKNTTDGDISLKDPFAFLAQQHAVRELVSEDGCYSL